MAEYHVRIPINASVTTTVEAESEEEAIEKAMKGFDLELHPKSESGNYDLEEWNFYTKMLEGNFWYGIIYEAEAEEW